MQQKQHPQEMFRLAETHLSRDMRRAVAKLTPRQREVVLLVYVIGLNRVEAAKGLGISQQRASQLLARSIAVLKKEFDVP